MKNVPGKNLMRILRLASFLFLVQIAKGQEVVTDDPSSTTPSNSVPGSLTASPIAQALSAACDRLQQRLDAYKAAHESCLDTQKNAKPGPESDEICSYTACQAYHSYVYGSAGKALAQQIASCRASAIKYQNRQAAETSATQVASDVLAGLTTGSPTAALDSQTDLTAFDQQKSAEGVIGDKTDAHLSMTDDVQKIAENDANVSPGKDDKALDELTAEAEKGENQTNSRKALEVAGDVAKDYLKQAASMWKETKEFAELAEPFNKLSDAMDAADIASSGKLPSTIPGVNQLSTYVDKQANALDTLSKKSANDWLMQSGLNSFNSAGTAPQAQQYLDSWSQRLTNMQQLITNSLPSLQVAQRVLENPTVNGTRMALNTTMAGLDPLVVQDLITQLNLSSSRIATIQEQLKLARSVAH